MPTDWQGNEYTVIPGSDEGGKYKPLRLLTGETRGRWEIVTDGLRYVVQMVGSEAPRRSDFRLGYPTLMHARDAMATCVARDKG